MTEQSKPDKQKSPGMGCLGYGVVALIVMFSPLFLAILNTKPGSNPLSEGDPGSGAAGIWLMMLTIPIAFVIVIVGIAKSQRRKSEQNGKFYGSPDFPDMM